MKKLMLSIILGLFCTTVQAEELVVKDVVDNVPPVKTGIAFSLVENNLNFMAVFPIYTLNKFTVNTGYAGAQPNSGHKAIIMVDYELFNPENIDLGNSIFNKVVNAIDIRPGIWAGAGRIEKDEPETDVGISITLLQAKFY